LFIYNLCDKDDEKCQAKQIFAIVGLFSVGLMQLISGVFFASAVLRIRRHLISQGGALTINVTMLLINSAAFSLYILSTMVFYVFYTIFYFDENQSSQNQSNGIVSWIVSSICGLISQLCLCAICWHISSKRAPTPQQPQTETITSGKRGDSENKSRSSYTLTSSNDKDAPNLEEIEVFDEDCEMQARLWN